jgi:uncharacterized protein
LRGKFIAIAQTLATIIKKKNMKNLIIITLGFFFLIPIYAQQKGETIDIITEANQMIMPDILEINIDLKYSDKNEQEALNRLNVGIDNQIQSIENAGFSRDNIKLCEFNIEEISDWESGKYKISGYEAVQSIKVKIPISDKKLIDSLMQKLTINKNENIEVEINAVLSNELNQKIQNDLIRTAIADATEKAQIIAESLNIKLGNVKAIEYGDLLFRPLLKNTIRFTSPIIEEEQTKVHSTNAYHLLGISETEVAEKIHIIWYIE